MVARASIVVLGLVIGLALPMGGMAAASGKGSDAPQAVLKREDDAVAVAVADDDDDDDTRSGYTSGVNSNDHTGSRHTAVSKDRDRSRGDKTRDWTRDGKGGKKRDWSGGHTNDRSRNDTR